MTKKEKAVEEIVKINKWDGSAVKHALDDCVKNALMNRPNMQEQFGLINTRLVLCALSVGVAIFAHCWDYTHPFPESRPMLLISVLAYFALMGILTLHTTFREKGTFAVAIQKDGNANQRLWEASSEMDKYDHRYMFILTAKDMKTNALLKTSVTKSCADYIDANGIVLDCLVANEVINAFNALSNQKTK